MAGTPINEYDIVRLKDGREGTVVEIYNVPGLPLGYEIEIVDKYGRTVELFTVEVSEIQEVIWSARKE